LPQTHQLAKERLAEVKKYFDRQIQPGDRWESITAGAETGFRLIQTGRIGGREQTLELVRLAGQRPKAHSPFPVMGELNLEVAAGRHTQAEFDAVDRQYADLNQAYFKRVLDEKGVEKSEADAIYARYLKIAKPELAALDQAERAERSAPRDRAAEKAKAAELKAKMKALKAKGDLAGMMKLAREARAGQPDPMEDPKVQSYTAAMSRDNWKLWLECLAEIKRAAFWTDIRYHAAALR
jgi:hypothetical protein